MSLDYNRPPKPVLVIKRPCSENSYSSSLQLPLTEPFKDYPDLSSIKAPILYNLKVALAGTFQRSLKRAQF